ncbi:MAG: hypothetical protein Q9199_002673 [Rusavskia elegans]
MAAPEGPTSAVHEASAAVHSPRIIIKYCTQCKWMLRAGWYAQELLSTFSTTLGEVALVPATGGVFTVDILHSCPTSTSEPDSEGPSDANDEVSSQHSIRQLWDRKAQGGFPEIKELKRLVRDIVEPTRDLGHVDRHGSSIQKDNRTGPVVSNQPPNQPPNRSSKAESSVTSTMTAFPRRPKNEDAQSKQPTAPEVAASRTAEKMVADIMNEFEEKGNHDGSSGRSESSRTGVKGDGVEQGPAQSEDEEENKRDSTHSARQGCEDCE